MIVHSFFSEGEDEEKDGFDRFAAFCAFLGIADAPKSTPMWARLSTGRDLLLGWAEGGPRYLQRIAWLNSSIQLVSRFSSVSAFAAFSATNDSENRR